MSRCPSKGISGQPRAVSKASCSGRPSSSINSAACFRSMFSIADWARLICLCAGASLGAECNLSAGQATSQRHPDQALDHTAVESVARIFGLARSRLHPTGTAARLVSGGEILLRKVFAGAQQLNHRFPQVEPRLSMLRRRLNRSACWCCPTPRLCVRSHCRSGTVRRDGPTLPGDFAPQERNVPFLR